MKFMFIGALFLVSNNNLYLSVPQDRAVFFELLYSWTNELYGQGLQIAGYVVNSEWLPENSSVGR